jgi:hypothetical protein
MPRSALTSVPPDGATVPHSSTTPASRLARIMAAPLRTRPSASAPMPPTEPRKRTGPAHLGLGIQLLPLEPRGDGHDVLGPPPSPASPCSIATRSAPGARQGIELPKAGGIGDSDLNWASGLGVQCFQPAEIAGRRSLRPKGDEFVCGLGRATSH